MGFGIYLASRFSLEEVFKIIFCSVLVTVALSYAFAIALPKYGIMGGKHTGAWRGIFTHKNSLGGYLVFGLSVVMIGTFSKQKFFGGNLRISSIGKFLLPLSFLLLILTQSTSALLNAVVALLLLSCFNVIKTPDHLITPASTTMIISLASFILFLAIGLLETVLGAFGKDLTLTGRTEIWPLAIDKIQERPWLGYGYFSFWNGLDGESADIIRALRWPVPYAHNGFIDLTLYLGLVGLLLFLIGFSVAFIRSVFWIRIQNTAISFLPLIYMIYTAQANITESTLMVRNSGPWVLYTAIVYSLSYEVKKRRSVNQIGSEIDKP